MQIRLEKFDHHGGRHRYCVLSLSQTLFGDWCVSQALGPIAAPGGRERRSYFSHHCEALQLFEAARDHHLGRGYVPIPVQLGLL
ncbi:WGR domain-containing protein [Phaeobacter sp. PT47_59]|uniref:WGR domain-containing protein n=1 Tax=Phaeobacter sp. PT47_59 TaxID=3029979 RepID=UPI0023807E72|nr:WGR domain-containing protein [Phaeobacter sp. PT47_59]MDE4176170.1 WGR domain-containing protein [Phaeobacter sp. PT47_59]